MKRAINTAATMVAFFVLAVFVSGCVIHAHSVKSDDPDSVKVDKDKKHKKHKKHKKAKQADDAEENAATSEETEAEDEGIPAKTDNATPATKHEMKNRVGLGDDEGEDESGIPAKTDFRTPSAEE